VITYTKEEIERFISISHSLENETQRDGMKKLLSVYPKIKIFDGLNTNEVKSIIYGAKFQKYNEKEFIVEDGELSNDIYYLIDGKCEIIKNGKKITTIEAGQTFGDNGLLLEQTKRIVSVVAASKKVVVLSFKIDHSNLEFGSKALVKVYQNIMRQLRDKLENVKFN